MREYNGQEGGATFDDAYAREWVTEPTLFYTHHQNTFAASAAAAVAMAEGLEKGDSKVMAPVRGRDLEYSHDFLLAMGIDVSTTAPYEALARRMSAKMDQLERELKAMGL